MVSVSPAKKVLVSIANGTEPMEAVITVDVLRRAGVDVTVASVKKQLRVEACHRVKIVADALVSDCSQSWFDLIALLPGFTFSMKSGPKDGWHSTMPLCLRGKSASRLCMFSNVKTADCSPGNVPVYLNVYDLTPANGYVCWAGVGIFHSGVEVYGVEYAFGAHEYSSSGVFEVEPRQCPAFKFRRSIFMGATSLDPFQVRSATVYSQSPLS